MYRVRCKGIKGTELWRRDRKGWLPMRAENAQNSAIVIKLSSVIIFQDGTHLSRLSRIR
jgi:hypothetical protein